MCSSDLERLPGAVISKDKTEMAGINTGLWCVDQGRVGALGNELVTAQIEHHGMGAAPSGATSEPLDVPALRGLQINGGDGEMELDAIHEGIVRLSSRPDLGD